MGILMGIVSFVLGFAINLVDSAVTSMLNSVGYDMSTFLAVFPFAENAMDVFVALGLAFLTGGLIWNGIKGVAAPFGVEYENPLHIIGKVAITWIAVVNLTEILDLIIRFFQIALDYMNDLPLGTGEFSVEGFASNLVTGLIADLTATSGLLIIVYIICVILLGWKFIKLLVEMVERYIVFCFICLVGPCFISTAAFKSSRDIAGTWFRAFFGQSFLILLNTFCARAFLSYCQVFTQNLLGINANGTFVPTISMLFFGFAFLNFASRVDTLLRILGLNTAHTGSGLLDGAIGGISRLINSARSMQTVGSAIGHAAAAGKAAGGLGTFAGMKAAAATAFSDLTGQARNTGDSTRGGMETNRRKDGTKADQDAPGRRVNAETPLKSGDLLRQEGSPSSQVMKGQQEIDDALRHKTNPNSENGIGGTNGIKGTGSKMDFVDGGVLASAGQQNEFADKFHGSGKPMGAIHQYSNTANGVRAAATSAERFTTPDGKSMPISSYKGAEAAAAMNGVTAFGNENLKDFNYAEEPDGASFISGQNFTDGSSVTFDSVEGGVATGVYTDADGNSTAFQMVHDNAVESQKQAVAAGVPGAMEFDTSQSVGRIGDGSGETGFYVIPKTAGPTDATTVPYGHTQTYAQMGATVDPNNSAQVKQARENLARFVDVSNPVEKDVSTTSSSRVDQMRREARTSTPRGKRRK